MLFIRYWLSLFLKRLIVSFFLVVVFISALSFLNLQQRLGLPFSGKQLALFPFVVGSLFAYAFTGAILVASILTFAFLKSCGELEIVDCLGARKKALTRPLIGICIASSLLLAALYASWIPRCTLEVRYAHRYVLADLDTLFQVLKRKSDIFRTSFILYNHVEDTSLYGVTIVENLPQGGVRIISAETASATLVNSGERILLRLRQGAVYALAVPNLLAGSLKGSGRLPFKERDYPIDLSRLIKPIDPRPSFMSYGEIWNTFTGADRAPDFPVLRLAIAREAGSRLALMFSPFVLAFLGFFLGTGSRNYNQDFLLAQGVMLTVIYHIVLVLSWQFPARTEVLCVITMQSCNVITGFIAFALFLLRKRWWI